jgi:signal transduction histidine kinase/CheY-like chemotaxis protein
VHRNAKGEDFPASVSLVVVELSGSCLVQATVRDESERRRLFAQMAQADRLASMGMLAGGVSHDINNPLAFVRYNLESLAEDLPKLTSAIRRICRAGQAGLGDKEHRALLGDDAPLFEDASLDDIIARQTEALEGVERIISITRALSTFSRVDQGDRTKVDVAVAIEAAVNMAHNEVAHRARLSSAIKPLPFVWASEGKLSHAFLNLIVNAARAIDEGDAPNNLISICAWAEDQAVIVEISDTGKGIDAERLEHVFDPFYTTGSLENGPGLGVSISKSILAEFGGTLNVASKPGMGSRFTVRLPEMKEPRGPTEQRGRAELEPTPGTRARILVIDDEPNILRALTRTLSGEYAVVSVASGRDAQRLISTDSQFDLVLCDLMMSQVSGTELHAWLAKHHPKLAKQVVFITGGAFTPKARDYLASVDNLTLEKPFNAAELRQRVANAVRIGRQQN